MRHNTIKYFLFIFFILGFSSTLHAQTIQGKVVKVTDGDTITILTPKKQQVKIRLYGIDTPEKKQAFGQKATQFTASLVAGKQVSVKVYDTDRYGRAVGTVHHGDINVNQEIIENGFAWVYTKYCKETFCRSWKKFETKARNNHQGLWTDKTPSPPWDWRRDN